jgi:hypothetical protein
MMVQGPSAAKQAVSAKCSQKPKADASCVIQVQQVVKDNISKNIKSKSTTSGYKEYCEQTLAYVEKLKENEDREEVMRKELTNLDD